MTHWNGVFMPIHPSDMLIKVKENEWKPLLDRESVTSDAKNHLTPWLELIRDLVNYGTMLIPRCVQSSDRKTKDRILLVILLRQLIAMLDGVEILLASGAVYAANLQMRALFEAAVYIQWILEGDSETKALYYHVHNLRRKRMWCLRTEPGTPEATAFAAQMSNYGIALTDEVSKKSKQQLVDIDRILTLPELSPINIQFEALKKQRHLRHDVSWYVPLGMRNFGAVARATGNDALYTLLYGGASEVMHSSSDDHHIRVHAGRVRIKPIRFLSDFPQMLRFSTSLALSVYMKILGHYRPDERKMRFGRKYMENWQRLFMNLPRITYEEAGSISI